jgi:hypothetical protein
MNKLVVAVALAVFSVGSVAIATGTPAMADYASCPAGTACVWNDPGGIGAKKVIAYSAYPGPCYEFNDSFDNSISSVKVDYGNNHPLVMWTDDRCGRDGGRAAWYYPGTERDVWSFDNQFSSFAVI